jgi:hypothetical protein
MTHTPYIPHPESLLALLDTLGRHGLTLTPDREATRAEGAARWKLHDSAGRPVRLGATSSEVECLVGHPITVADACE